MTKITLTCRKTLSSQNLNSQLSSSSASINNNTPNYVNRNESNVIYRPLSTTTTSTSNDEYIDSQFQKPPSQIPTKSICLAIFLCLAGTSLLGFGMLVLTGHLDAKVDPFSDIKLSEETLFADRAWPMIIMGSLMFIPGAYHVRIAYYAYKGYPGYSFDDIPEFE